ncbi:MAG: hypothetical protein IK083_04295 [Abditibacteriota bacterium]|nr:hypothetical protein [Abditibacteriota bacterium]
MKKTLLLILAAALFCIVCFRAGSAYGDYAARKQTESAVPPGPVSSAAKAYRPFGASQLPRQTVSPADRKTLKSGGPSHRVKYGPDNALGSMADAFPCKIYPDSDYALDLGLTPKQRKKLESLNKRYFRLFEAEYKRELGVYMTRITGPHPLKEYVKLESDGKSEALGAGYEKEFRSFLTPTQTARCRVTVEADTLGYDLNHHSGMYPKPHDIYFFRSFGLTDRQKDRIERLSAEYGDSLKKSRSPLERLKSAQEYKTRLKSFLDDSQKEQYENMFRGSPLGFRKSVGPKVKADWDDLRAAGAPVKGPAPQPGAAPAGPDPAKKIPDATEAAHRDFAADFPGRLAPDAPATPAVKITLSAAQKKKVEELNKRYFALYEAEYKRQLRLYMSRIDAPASAGPLTEAVNDDRSEAIGKEYEQALLDILTPEQRELRAKDSGESRSLYARGYFYAYPRPHGWHFFRDMGLSEEQQRKIRSLNEKLGKDLASASDPLQRSTRYCEYKNEVTSLFDRRQTDLFYSRFNDLMQGKQPTD